MVGSQRERGAAAATGERCRSTRASFTRRSRPLMTNPSSCSIAIAASVSLGMLTNPKPRDRPVSLSAMMAQLLTSPNRSKDARSSSVLTDHSMFATKIRIVPFPFL